MNQIIDEAYKNYNNYMTENFMETRWCKVELSPDGKSVTGRKCNREEFIIESKIQPGFSEKWGLKIEERELSLEEKEYQLEKTNCINDIENDRIIYGHEWEKYIQEQYEGIQLTQGIKIPTKLITITYNNETIEIYEN